MLLQRINHLHYETMLPILKQYESRIDITKTLLSARGLKWCVTLRTMSWELFPFKLYWIFITPCQSVQLRGDLAVWIMNWIIIYPRNISGRLIILLELDVLDRAMNDWATKRSKRFISLLFKKCIMKKSIKIEKIKRSLIHS